MSDTETSRRIVVAGLLSLLPASAVAQIQLPGAVSDFLKSRQGAAPAAASTTPAGASLSQNQIGAGLKDAMKVASRKVIGQVGKPGGYFNDPAIRIPLPGGLERVAGPLRSMGAAGLLDDLSQRMNRGAEQAAPKALNIFVDAASGMSFDDARGILTGPQDSVTQYFKRTCSPTLTTEFHPIVANTLAGAGAMRALKSVQDRISAMPMIGQMAGGFDLVDFTVGKALDGLFHYLAVEEGNIRSNPLARSTSLLKSVFGN
ncbi:MAG: DUF4197 domain-containing protein [Alphaproteobacteria bacterium]